MDNVTTLNNYGQKRVFPLRVRLIHTLIIVLSTLAAVAIAAPVVLSQPTLYTSQAVVRFDPQSVPPLLADGKPTPLLQERQGNLGGILERTQYPSLRQYGLDYRYTAPHEITIVTAARNPLEAQSIAHDAADGLARRVEAIGGADLLRMMLGQELNASLRGQPAQGREHELLRELVLTQAVPCIGPQAGTTTFADLTPGQRSAVARALEVQEEQILYNQAITSNATNPDSQAQLGACVPTEGFGNKLRANRDLVGYLIATYDADATMREAGRPVLVAQDAATATAIPNYAGAKLLLAAFVGAIGGGLTVLVDRQVGIIAKLQELWSYRQLIRNMIARDLKSRYKNSVLGYVWTLLNPLLTMLVFWVVFGLLLPNPTPMFPVFLIVALLPWSFAVSAVAGGMRAIIDNGNLIKKVYFPREILPITVVLSNFINYVLALPMMFLVMAGVQWFTLGYINFSWSFTFLPVIVVLQIIFLIGVALFLSTMAVFFRDTTHIVDIFIQLWIFLTPVFFSLEQIVSPTYARVVRWLNPMASIIDFYRDILYGQPVNIVPDPGLPALAGVFRTLLTVLIVLAFGSYVFHRYSNRFGEEI